jgi:DNA-binding IclR family transcriptional regulator
MERAGCTAPEIHRVVAQCALDSIPGIRAAVIDLLRHIPSNTSEVARSIRVSASAAKRTLEDLRLHGLAECTQGDGNGSWRLSDTALSLMKAGWGELDD